MPDKNSTCLVKAGKFDFSFSKEEIAAADFIKRSETEFNIIKDHRSANVKLLEVDASAKKMKLEVEGETFDIEIQDELDMMLEKMGLNKASTRQVKEVKAPMPGLVLQVAVKEGDEVNEGDRILILEAMKMENSIMIHAAAKIKKVKVKAGQAVDKGQVLVELE